MAQLLLTKYILLEDRRINVQNALNRIIELGSIPIVNENDTVSIDELELEMGENDSLAANVAVLANADLLIIMSDIEGLFDKDILAILDKHGMKVTEVEYIVQWAEEHRSYEQKYKEQLCFHMCELFDVKQINCGLMENYSVEYTAQKLRELCQRAGKYIIGVEPMPYSGIPNLQKGWEVVKASGCENAMLILDTWHWVRANQPYDILTPEIAEKVISIQINDAYERPYADSILRDESMHDRLAPGTGVHRISCKWHVRGIWVPSPDTVGAILRHG